MRAPNASSGGASPSRDFRYASSTGRGGGDAAPCGLVALGGPRAGRPAAVTPAAEAAGSAAARRWRRCYVRGQ